MKLKKFLGAVATACITLMMSMAVSAATDIKAEGIYTRGNFIAVPIVITTTDMNNLSAYDVTVNYDTSKYTYARIVDTLTFYDDFWGEDATYGSLGTNAAANNDGTVTFNWFINNSYGYFPEPDENDKIKLAEVYFTPIGDYSENDFTVTATEIANQAEDVWSGNKGNMKSFFTFDVTGDLGGNRVVALGASTDGGAKIQPLEYYTTTNYTKGMEYAKATTTFLVAVNNSGADEVADITIYGQLEDGKYIPLTTYDQSDFLVQDFK